MHDCREEIAMDLYIYYRVPVANAAALQAQVVAMQQCISRECDIVAQLKRRPEAKDGMHTWMEIYHAVPPDFDAVLARAVSQARLMALIDNERHTEFFLDCSTCA
jgi:hypothetical protein